MWFHAYQGDLRVQVEGDGHSGMLAQITIKDICEFPGQGLDIRAIDGVDASNSQAQRGKPVQP